LDYRATSDKGLLSALAINNPELNPKQILQVYGLRKALEAVTTRELQTILSNYSARSWQRFIAEKEKIKLPRSQSSFMNIREQLTKFKPLKVAQIVLV